MNLILNNIVGNVITEMFSGGSNWTLTGTNDFTYASKLTLSGSNTSSYDKYITLNNSVNTLRTFTIQWDWTIKDIGVSFNGYAIGLKSVNPNSGGLTQLFEFNCQSGVISAFNKLLGFSTTRVQLTGNLNCLVNDIIKCEIDSINGLASITFYNSRSKEFIVYSLISDTYHNTGKFAIYSLGGTNEIANYSISCKTNVRPDILFIGDSQSTIPGNPPDRLANKFNYFVKYTGSGDSTTEAIQSYNFLPVSPKIVIIELGINDIATGVSLATFQSRITTIRNYFIANGSSVYILEIPTFGNSNAATWNSSNTTLYGSGNMIPIYTSLLGSGTSLNAAYDSGDGTHWNSAGQLIVTNAIANKTGY